MRFLPRRDPAFVGPAGGRGEIDHAAVQVPVPDFRLSVLRRPELDRHDRPGRPSLRQHQAEGAEYFAKFELRRQSNSQRDDKDRQVVKS